MISLRQAEQQQARPTQTQPATQPVAKPTAQPTNHTRTVTAPMANFTRAATGGLGKIGDALMMPSTAFGGFLQGTRKSAERNAPLVKSGRKNFFSAIGDDVTAGVKNIKTGVDKKVTPGTYLTNDVLKMKEGKAKFATSLATDLTVDPLNAVGGVIPKVATKLNPALKTIQNTKAVKKVVDVAKKTPAIYKPIEATVKPYFRNPEAGKIIEGAKETITTRQQTLFREISQASKGLSPAKQARVGQLLEGGVTTGKTEPRLAQIANYFREVGEGVGKELVDEGLLDPKSYEKYKGKYMHHFWKNAAEGKDPLAGIADLPTIDKSILKYRKGAEGYVKEFAAPTFKGLGTGMRDVEAAKMFKRLGSEFGIDAEKKITSNDLAGELVNTLLKNKPRQPRKGLGDIPFEQTWAYKENPGLQMIDLLKKIPAVTPLKTRMGTKAKVGSILEKGKVGYSGAPDIGTPGYSHPGVAARKPVLPQADKYKIELGKVGSLPKVKETTKTLRVEDAKRIVDEGYQYAPDELTKSRGAGVLKDVALPQEIIDYLKRTQKTDSGTAMKIYDKGMSAWKAGKTIYNPAYHARNIVSNTILADMQTGRGLAGTAKDFVVATRQLKGKGNQKWVTEAIDNGIIRKKAFSEGLNELADPFKKEGVLKKIATSPMKFQNESEDVAKLAVYSHYRQRGLSAAKAKLKAEEAIFSPYKISGSERKFMSRVVPFYSFARQAAPFTAKTLVKHPERLAKYPKIETNVEKLSENDKPNEKNMPDWMKGMVRTPLKNNKGENKYLNTQFTYPYGGFIDEASGGVNPTFGFSSPPLLQEIMAQTTGEDPYFKSKFVREGQTESEQVKARLDHAATTFLPNAYRTVKGKIIPAAQGKTDYQGRSRDLPEVLAGELAGVKTYPYSTAQGNKNRSYQQYKINDDFKSEQNRIFRDQSLTSKEKMAKLKEIIKRRQDRLKKL